MFTGIIQAVGTVTALERHHNDLILTLHTADLDTRACELGASIAVNGVCLTVTDWTETGFKADVSAETLSLTTLDTITEGARVNLETPATPTTLLGGHLVQGHVDGTARVSARTPDGASVRFELEAPRALAPFIASKGSICLDGVSLTVNHVEHNTFTANIIPHTLERTILGEWRTGSHVNLECDMIARYLQRLTTQGL